MDWLTRADDSGLYENCESCGLTTHTRCHPRDALAAYDKEIELDTISHGHDHPVVARTIKHYDNARRRKARYNSPILRGV